MKAFLSWSGGKDAAFCLYRSLRERIPVQTLVTNLDPDTGRIAMHGVRCELIEEQAASIGMPLRKMELPAMPDKTKYEKSVREFNRLLAEEGFTHAVFGDIFLEDLKLYRESLYRLEGLTSLFPIWNMNTGQMISEFLEAGFKAVVVCVNNHFLPQSFCGRELDESFIRDLPPGVDPCGEYGEYHSFVFDGPIFSKPVSYRLGEKRFEAFPAPKGINAVTDTYGFYFADLLPAPSSR
jgi:uncharacterized protein (TIGR00290 family)